MNQKSQCNYVIILHFRIGRLLSLSYEVSIDEIRQRVRTCVSEFRRLSHFLEYAGIFCSIIVFNIRVPGNLENWNRIFGIWNLKQIVLNCFANFPNDNKLLGEALQAAAPGRSAGFPRHVRGGVPPRAGAGPPGERGAWPCRWERGAKLASLQN